MPNAEIVAIGSELLLGQIVDTNSPWMAQRLANVGMNLFYKSIVGDNPARMREVLSRALERSDVVITSGGLGPTQADITRQLIAEVTGRKLVLEPSLLADIEERFRKRGFIMTPNNEKQAYIPEGAIPVRNPNGTAPAFVVEDTRSAIFALPGVPFELKWLFDNEVIPYLRKKFGLGEIITYKVLKISDLGESAVDDRIGHLIATSSNPTVGILAHPGQVDVRIAAKAASAEDAERLIAPVEAEVRRLLGRHVFAVNEETMEDAVGKLLRVKNVTVALYEDITGGLVADRLEVSSPDHFAEAIIGNGERSILRLLAHSRQPRLANKLLGEPAELTRELAWTVRAISGSNLGLALHARPDLSDTVENLARGQTFIAVTDGVGFRSRVYNSAGRGRPDRTRMSLSAVELLRMALLEGME
jgi:nicotinamide-nucleotide amidase